VEIRVRNSRVQVRKEEEKRMLIYSEVGKCKTSESDSPSINGTRYMYVLYKNGLLSIKTTNFKLASAFLCIKKMQIVYLRWIFCTARKPITPKNIGQLLMRILYYSMPGMRVAFGGKNPEKHKRKSQSRASHN